MTALAVAVEQNEGAAKLPVTQDPLAIRWGIQCVERDTMVPGFQAGFTQLKYAQFFRIAPFPIPVELHSVDDDPNLPRENIETQSATKVQRWLEERFAGKDDYGNVVDKKPNKGMKVGFFGEGDDAKMTVISKTLFPSLSRIREISVELEMDSPIAAVCEGTDGLDFEPRESCPTCWQKWLVSGVCDEFVARMVTSGMEVYDANDPEKRWTVKPSAQDFATARQMAIASVQDGIRYSQGVWNQIATELETPGARKALDDAGLQNLTRKDIHQPKPEDRQLLVAKEFAKAQQAPTGNNDGLAMMAEALKILGANQERTNTLLEEVLTAPAAEEVVPTTKKK